MSYQYNSTSHNHHDDGDEDARMAADMQMALDMQDAETEAHLYEEEERRTQQQQPRQRNDTTTTTTNRNPTTTPVPPIGRSGRGQFPVVQGRTIARQQPPVLSSLSSSSPSGAQLAVTSDGFTLQQNKNLIYVAAEIHERLVEMMVDTGAQSSVISSQLMKRLGLESKLNRQMQGMAQGVGKARILGIIENFPAQIGHVEFLLYFLVLDVPQDMIIFGIDQMRRFKCVIDLDQEKLIFGGKDGVEVSFLPPENDWINARNQALSDNCVIS
mmetsp:Transcript_15897/g.20758  ORF Transcript_15897/g.20758 Transcript_15897/m.20758 type:complete len:270 (+) Transcript_15897:418-1227(+)|eukprot:CAMPEP_0198144062 /NCGR_PEP_ID=MMETSP1443-20131203/12568_1 /TAXON_ID=186043 /ORGANISM="Entomoneis sp., Strain CCMP2396" /LENGTH=269 /DNA_ID=CAMNT_0043807397 /DNA_START=305 /DNA_END=1114 /DNA_ORIENTATION=-